MLKLTFICVAIGGEAFCFLYYYLHLQDCKKAICTVKSNVAYVLIIGVETSSFCSNQHILIRLQVQQYIA